MAPTLYMIPASPPVRAVKMTAKAIGLALIEKEIDVLGGAHLNPEYVKLNPQHTVPTFVDDDGFQIWDSHAIMAYIVAKYGKNDSLYPKDMKKRAVVDQRLHFDTGVAFERMKIVGRPIMFEGKTRVTEEDKTLIEEMFGFLEAFLKSGPWIAGDSVTIADYSLISTITSINVMIPVDGEKFPKVAAWIKRCEELPEYDENAKGLKVFDEMLGNKLKNV